MANTDQKLPLEEKNIPAGETSTAAEFTTEFERPQGWMYKDIKIGSWSIGWYASPKIQLGMVAFVCFLCPGMFNALGNLGGGGKIDTTLGDNMNTALYSTFAVVGFFAGTFVNRLGIRLALSFGGVGYCIYAASLLASLYKDVSGFNIFAGALLGVCAGLLWTAQGTIMMSYPPEHLKGRYFTWFWGIFNVGACIGSLVILGENAHVTTKSNASTGTYVALIVLMFIGACLALFLVDANKVIRSDGSRIILMQSPSWKTEFIGLYQTILGAPYIVLLFPMFWFSNWFYTYQTNAVNSAIFSTRTKALNGFLYWFAQIVAAAILGPLLDANRFSRPVRAQASLVILFVLTMAIWGGGYDWQKWYTRASVDTDTTDFKAWDWTSPGHAGPMALYFFYGMYDGLWQGCVYWYMGALGNSGRKLANLAGFYKGLQSAGAAVMWSLDRDKMSYMNEFITNWVGLSVSLLIAAPVVFLYIKDHVPIEEDLKGTDATIEDIFVGGHHEKIVPGVEAA